MARTLWFQIEINSTLENRTKGRDASTRMPRPPPPHMPRVRMDRAHTRGIRENDGLGRVLVWLTLSLRSKCNQTQMACMSRTDANPKPSMARTGHPKTTGVHWHAGSGTAELNRTEPYRTWDEGRKHAPLTKHACGPNPGAVPEEPETWLRLRGRDGSAAGHPQQRPQRSAGETSDGGVGCGAKGRHAPRVWT